MNGKTNRMTDLLSRMGQAAARPESGTSLTWELRTSRRAELARGRRERASSREEHACTQPVADHTPWAGRRNTNSARVAHQSGRAELARERHADAIDRARHAGRTRRADERRAGTIRASRLSARARRRGERNANAVSHPPLAGRAGRRPDRHAASLARQGFPGRAPGRRDDGRGHDDRWWGETLTGSSSIADLARTAGRPGGEA